MFEKFKANLLFNRLLKRPDIKRAYAIFENVAKFAFKKNPDTVANYALERFENEFEVKVEDFECVDIVSKCDSRIYRQNNCKIIIKENNH